jgi:hypothetical protein
VKGFDFLLTRESRDKPKEFLTEDIIIDGRGIIFSDTVVQISNITHIWVENLSYRKALPNPLVTFGIIGLLVFAFGVIFQYAFSTITGLAILAAVGFGYYVWKNRSEVQRYAINIELTSGRHYSFLSPSRMALAKPYALLRELICEGGKPEKYVINAGNGTVLSEAREPAEGIGDNKKAGANDASLEQRDDS